MSGNPYNNSGMGGPPQGNIPQGNMNGMNMNNPRMGMMGSNMNRMPTNMGFQDQMGGGGMPYQGQGRPMGGPGMPTNMGPMGGMGNRMPMGPGMVRGSMGPGPGQYGMGATGHSGHPGSPGPTRMMSQGPGMVSTNSMSGNVRMTGVSPMDTSGPQQQQQQPVPQPQQPQQQPQPPQQQQSNLGPVVSQAGQGAETMMTDGAQEGSSTVTTTGSAPATGGKVTPTPGQKGANMSTVCRVGQETVEEIVSRTQEVFSILKSLQPPYGAFSKAMQHQDQANIEKQKRLNDVLNGIGMLFKRLQLCWDKCQENSGGMDFYPIESLIPYKDEALELNSGKTELEKKRGDVYKSALDEHNELVQQITFKNRHLKDIIDQMRNIIWEINTMLAMRTN